MFKKIICLAGIFILSVAGKGIEEKKENFPTLTCPFSTKAPVIDGKIGKEEWKDASKATGFFSLSKVVLTDEELRKIYRKGYSLPKNLAKEQTEVFVMRDKKNLYIAFRCYESRLESLRTLCQEHDGPVWNDDSIEIFIDSNLDRATYFHFVANASGIKFESKNRDKHWDGKWEVKTSINKKIKAYEVEISIPFKTLGVYPEKEDIWGLNLCRNRIVDIKDPKDRECSSWADLSSAGYFHSPSLFGYLIFDEKSDIQALLGKKHGAERDELEERFKEKPGHTYIWFEAEDRDKFEYSWPFVEVSDPICRGGKAIASKQKGGSVSILRANLSKWNLPVGRYFIYAKVYQYAPCLSYATEFHKHKAKGISYINGSTTSTHDAFLTSFTQGKWIALKLAEIDVKSEQIEGILNFEFHTEYYGETAFKVDSIIVSTDEEFGLTLKDKKEISYIAEKSKQVKERIKILADLIEKAEKKGIDTTYPRMRLAVLNTFSEYPFLEAKERKIQRGLTQIEYLFSYSKDAIEEIKGIIEDPTKQIPFPEYDIRKIKIKGSNFYSGKRPVLLNSPGYIQRIYLKNVNKEFIPRLKDLGMNCIHAAIGIGEKGAFERDKKATLEALKDAEREGIKVVLLLYETYFRSDRGFTIDNPKRVENLMKEVKNVVSLVKDSPALLGYDILGEYEQRDWPVAPNGKFIRGNDFDKYTLPAFRKWLKRKHGSIEKLNQIWGKNYKDFSEIEPEDFVKKDGGNGRYDWEMFRRERSVEFVKKYIKAIREVDKKRPISVMTMAIDRGFMDVEEIDHLTDISGCDPGPMCETLYGEDEGVYYEIRQSFDSTKPIVNWEYHIYRIKVPPPEWVKAMLWKGYLHGLDGVFVWNFCPMYRFEHYPADWNNLFTQPQLFNAISETFLDTQRLAPYIVKFQSLPADVAILYSLTSIFHKKDYYIAYELGTKSIYNGITFLSIPVDYITDRQISKGFLRRYKVLVLPSTMSKYVKASTYKGIKEFVKRGGILVTTSSEALTFDEYGREIKKGDKEPLPVSGRYGKGRVFRLPAGLPSWEYSKKFDKIFDEIGLKRKIRVLDAETGDIAFGVEARYIRRKGKDVVYLLNLTGEEKRIIIKGIKGRFRELITNKEIPDVFDITLKGYGVMVIESLI